MFEIPFYKLKKLPSGLLSSKICESFYISISGALYQVNPNGTKGDPILEVFSAYKKVLQTFLYTAFLSFRIVIFYFISFKKTILFFIFYFISFFLLIIFFIFSFIFIGSAILSICKEGC